eukprot:CAMPEP_0202506354 /NCGR_PEP_ID=MMETSP1361-20130828/50058_1 /ASSEMBLY_ACC=CAM_ASM_000849 /TAXON_ID=210615 /ORGANISM="Staurosira complex sp., Strain CCMP2646" /LENGTH=31 /DNA_ID= /DNA_START= /DNA_END= /DNA_ORIENTATION=
MNTMESEHIDGLATNKVVAMLLKQLNAHHYL